MAGLGLATAAELDFTHVAVPELDTNTVTVPVAVNLVPGDEAAGRVPNPTVRTELAVTEAQEAKRRASEALRRGDGHEAAGLLTSASVALEDQLALAPASSTEDVQREVAELQALAESARFDDAKRSYASWHGSTSKRGRPAP